MLTGIYKEMGFDRPYHGSIEDQYNEYLRKHQAKQNKGARGKDSERQKTYEAEWRYQANHGSGREFTDINEVQKYVDKITKSKTYSKLVAEGSNIERLFTSNRVKVATKYRNTGRGTAGLATQGHITLDTKVGMNEYTVLHELAHCVGHWHHGRSFRQCLLKLVSRFMSSADAQFLKEEFKAGKLPVGNARKPMSFDQWVTTKTRMEKMRNE
jgi:putative metallohydrolase (TIGR04338 family)